MKVSQITGIMNEHRWTCFSVEAFIVDLCPLYPWLEWNSDFGPFNHGSCTLKTRVRSRLGWNANNSTFAKNANCSSYIREIQVEPGYTYDHCKCE